MPSLPFREADVAALLDPSSTALVRRLGPAAPWDVVGAALAEVGHPHFRGRRRDRSASVPVPGIWSRVAAEFTDFVCTESARYADLRAQWDDLCARSAAIAITALTASLAARLGVASTVVGPMVVWLVLSAVRIGTRAFCDARRR